MMMKNKKSKIKLTSIESAGEFSPPYIPVLDPSSSDGMAGEYIKELNSIFYGFLLKLTLSLKKKCCLYIFTSTWSNINTREYKKERNKKKFHNIPMPRSI